MDRSYWIRLQSFEAVEQMLSGVIGWLPDEWLGIDNEPRLPFCPENVARVQVGGEQDLVGRGAWQLSEEP